VAAVHNTFTHIQYTEYRDREIIERKENWEVRAVRAVRAVPLFANYTLAFALQLRKKHGKTSVRVAQY
jgi:hypothetical protein